MQHKTSLSALGLGAALFVSSILSANVASAHGWITSPPSRQDHCAKHTAGFDCGDIQYEPQSVEAPKGSMACSGGGRFPILDNSSLPWPVTNVSSTTTFQWTCTACHRTLNWEYFVDGGLLATINGNASQPNATFSHTINGLPSGRHTILARWNIYDTPSAFYVCVDVNVGGGGSTPTPTRTATATATAARATPTGARATATPTTPRATATPTTGSGGSCAGIAAFQSCTAYPSGTNVTYNGSRYHNIAQVPATRDCPPSSPFNPSNDNWWVNDGTCS
jgi:predicted carbohydrate-binding protein with CBM5 and CBM33 domain